MPSKKRIFDIIQIGQDEDWASRSFDFAVMIMILINLFIAIFETYESSARYLGLLNAIETVTVVFFTVEYALRVWTAEFLYRRESRSRAMGRYVLSLGGIIDLLSFLPFYLPVFFPAGVVAFRMFRIIRILRLFRINAYSDALSVITDVVKGKANQLLSSMFVILILMIASSLCMYSLEHEAQPDVFCNAFSGMWWSVSTLLTVGYGDIYPITVAGRFFAIVISFLGVGMVAIPTGILSAGFVEQYSRVKSLNDHAMEAHVRFVRVNVEKGHIWENRTVGSLQLPHDLTLSLIERGGELVRPLTDERILEGDTLILGAEDYQDDPEMMLQEIMITEDHPWNGESLGDLDVSRRIAFVMIRRGEQMLSPEEETVLTPGDVLLTYRRKRHRTI